MNIIDSIDSNFDSLSSSQKKAAAYIRKHHAEIALCSLKELAEKTAVSQATIVRLCKSIGYEGYPHFQKSLGDFVLNRRTVIRLNEYVSEIKENDSWLEKHFSQEIRNLSMTMAFHQEEKLNLCARALLSAERIFVAGWRSELSVSVFLSYILNYVLGNTFLVKHYEIAETSAKLKNGDVIFICGFSRYSKTSLKLALKARNSDAFVICLTDSELSPFVKYSDIPLFVTTNSKGFLDSYTAAVSIINALIKEIAFINHEEIQKNLLAVEENFEYFDESYKWGEDL